MRTARGALLAALCTLPLAGQLPPQAAAALDRRFPGWTLAPVSSRLIEWFEQDRRPGQPNLISGDFDRDARPDLALQILAGGRQHVVVLLNRGAQYDAFPAAAFAPDPLSFIVLFRQGERDFDFERMKPFRYSADCLGVLYSRRTADTFCFQRGKLIRRRSPGDEEAEARRQDPSLP